MKESEEKRKEAGTAKRFPPKFINEQKKLDSVTMLVWGFYSQTPLQNTKRKQKQKLLQGIKREENQKGGIKVKKSKSSMNSVKGRKIRKTRE